MQSSAWFILRCDDTLPDKFFMLSAYHLLTAFLFLFRHTLYLQNRSRRCSNSTLCDKWYTARDKTIYEKGGYYGGALFRRIRRGGHVQSERLTDYAARRIIQKRAANAGVDGFIAGHSLRVGSAVALAQAGASVVEMQIAGRWKSSQMPAHYAKSELAERGAIARYKEKTE